MPKQVTGLKSPKHDDLVVIKMENDDFNVECTHDHPFYVEGKGWSSFKPELTKTNYVDTFEEVAQLEAGDEIHEGINELLGLDIDDNFGLFDYIIVHGVLSFLVLWFKDITKVLRFYK